MAGQSWDVCTPGEAARIGRLKDRVGGYDEVERLMRERRVLGPFAELTRDEDGRLTYISAVEAARRRLRAKTD